MAVKLNLHNNSFISFFFCFVFFLVNLCGKVELRIICGLPKECRTPQCCQIHLNLGSLIWLIEKIMLPIMCLIDLHYWKHLVTTLVACRKLTGFVSGKKKKNFNILLLNRCERDACDTWTINSTSMNLGTETLYQ